jgi:hypothetical protein
MESTGHPRGWERRELRPRTALPRLQPSPTSRSRGSSRAIRWDGNHTRRTRRPNARSPRPPLRRLLPLTGARRCHPIRTGSAAASSSLATSNVRLPASACPVVRRAVARTSAQTRSAGRIAGNWTTTSSSSAGPRNTYRIANDRRASAGQILAHENSPCHTDPTGVSCAQARSVLHAEPTTGQRGFGLRTRWVSLLRATGRCVGCRCARLEERS